MKNKKLLAAAACFVLAFLLRFAGSSLLDLVGYLLIFAGAVLGIWGIVLRPKAPSYEEEAQYMDKDRAVSREIGRRQRRNLGIRGARVIIYLILIIPMIVCFFLGQYLIAVILCLLWLGISALLNRRIKDVKGFASENIVREALEEVFDVEDYQPFGCIPWQHISGLNFGFSHYNNVEGSDYVRGFYKGLPVELCDIRLSHKGTVSTDDGWKDFDDTSFRGLWLICDFGKELSADLTLWENHGIAKDAADSGIRTENEAFNKKFNIYCQVPEEIFYVLTPHMMEYILETERNADGDFHIRFDRGGKVHIAVGKKHDAFEVGSVISDAGLLRRKFVGEIRYITDIIDALRLVDTLYK